MKKLISLLLALTMIFALAACHRTAPVDETPPATDASTSNLEAPDSQDKPDEPKDIQFPLEEPLTFSMFSVINEGVELGDCAAFQEIEKNTNVHWEIQSALGVELAEKTSLLLGSSQYPDVFFRANLTPDLVNKYGPQGTLIPLNDLIEQYAPNFKAELDSRPGAIDAITAPDGNIYALPVLVRATGSWINSFVNEPWLEKLGLAMPTNLDEFYEMLVKFKTEDPNGNGQPDEIPFAATQDFLYYFLPNFDMRIDSTNGAYNMAEIDGTYQYIYTSENYKEFLAYMAKLYEEKLLDQNTFIQDGTQIQAVGASGDTIGYFFDLASYLTVGRERDADFLRVPVFAKNVLPFSTGVGYGTFAITDKCENPEVVMAWIDRFYTQEGGAYVFMGVENVSYQVNEDGSWEWIVGDYADTSALRAATTLNGGALPPGLQPDLWFENKDDVNEYKFQHDIPTDSEINKEGFPALKLSESDVEDLATINADITPYIKQYQAQVIIGEMDLESSWDQYIEKLDQMGLSRMMEIVLAAYDAAS